MSSAADRVEVTVFPGCGIVLIYQATRTAAKNFAVDAARSAIRVDIGGSAKPGTKPLPLERLWEDWPW